MDIQILTLKQAEEAALREAEDGIYVLLPVAICHDAVRDSEGLLAFRTVQHEARD